MYLSRSEYDRGVNTFSPEGRLFQVEYALEAIKLGTTALGICADEAVILAVEKRISSTLLEPASVEKLFQIDTHIACAVSGLTPDARSMIEHARVEAAAHRFQYDEPVPVESLTQAVCDMALRFGEGAHGEQRNMSRPFGVALLLAGVDCSAESTFANGSSIEDKSKGCPMLFHADPSGSYVAWAAKAIGAGSEGAQDELQAEYKPNMSVFDAESLAVRILGKIMEEKITCDNVEVASVSREAGYRVYSREDLRALLERAGITLNMSPTQA